MIAEGRVAARADALRQWAAGLPSAWTGAMEATIFTGWIYDVLKPYAVELQVGHPLRMEAITKAKKKCDRGSASTICDLLRANLLPTCTMLPPELRELRQVLRFRNKLVREAVRMHNHCAGLLMMNGVPYERVKLHRKRYFTKLLEALEEPAEGGIEASSGLDAWGPLDHVPEAVRGMLVMGRHSYEFFERAQQRLLAALQT